MLTIVSVEDGRILGFAKDHAGAQEMAAANGWRNWAIEETDLRELELVSDAPGPDPRNSRGRRL